MKPNSPKHSFDWGLDNIQKNAEFSEEDIQKKIILCDNVFNCFKTEHGAKTLAHLKKKFEEPPVCMPEWGTEGTYYGAMREGQRRMYKYIENLIEFSNKHRSKK